MNTIILKISTPHGWVYAENILEHYNSFLGISYLNTGWYFSYHTLSIPKEKVSIEKLKEGIQYWFQQEKYSDKSNLLILTDDTEEENQELITMIKSISIKRDIEPFNNCIIICNDFKINKSN